MPSIDYIRWPICCRPGSLLVEWTNARDTDKSSTKALSVTQTVYHDDGPEKGEAVGFAKADLKEQDGEECFVLQVAVSCYLHACLYAVQIDRCQTVALFFSANVPVQTMQIWCIGCYCSWLSSFLLTQLLHGLYSSDLQSRSLLHTVLSDWHRRQD